MTQGLLINDAFEFWPEENRLTSCNDGKVSFHLPTPASRCFLALLNNAPNVVPQAMLFQSGWDDGGKHVPQNTLYQNISILRKGIKTVAGGDAVVVQTVPKIGFKIDCKTILKEISISEHSCEELQRDFEGSLSKKIPTDFPRQGTFKTLFWRACCFKRTAYVYFCIFMGIVTSISLGLYSQEPDACDFSAEYKLMGEKDGCHYMGNFDALSWQNAIKNLKVNLTCDIYPWVYISAHRNMPTRTLIKCNEPITTKDKLKCISVHVKGLKVE